MIYDNSSQFKKAEARHRPGIDRTSRAPRPGRWAVASDPGVRHKEMREKSLGEYFGESHIQLYIII